MTSLLSKLAGAGLMLAVGLAGCGMIQGHVDCDKVAQQQRSGADDNEIANATGFSVADVQSCSQSASSSRETANNYQDQPNLPVVPMISAGSIR